MDKRIVITDLAFQFDGHWGSCSEHLVIHGDGSITDTKGRSRGKCIEELPPAQPQHGHWIDKGMAGDWQFQTDGRGNCWHVYECSECGETVKNTMYPYCPHCGANMRTLKQILHDAIDNTSWAEDAYPNIKEELHRVVDAVEEQSNADGQKTIPERLGKDCD